MFEMESQLVAIEGDLDLGLSCETCCAFPAHKCLPDLAGKLPRV